MVDATSRHPVALLTATGRSPTAIIVCRATRPAPHPLHNRCPPENSSGFFDNFFRFAIDDFPPLCCMSFADAQVLHQFFHPALVRSGRQFPVYLLDVFYKNVPSTQTIYVIFGKGTMFRVIKGRP